MYEHTCFCSDSTEAAIGPAYIEIYCFGRTTSWSESGRQTGMKELTQMKQSIERDPR